MMSSRPHTIHVMCRVVASCGSWYELMVGRLLFTTPLVISTDYDLVYSAEVCFLNFPIILCLPVCVWGWVGGYMYIYVVSSKTHKPLKYCGHRL